MRCMAVRVSRDLPPSTSSTSAYSTKFQYQAGCLASPYDYSTRGVGRAWTTLGRVVWIELNEFSKLVREFGAVCRQCNICVVWALSAS